MKNFNKRILFFLFTCFIGTSLVSCKKYLKEKPRTFISTETLFSTTSGVNAALDGVYGQLNAPGGSSVYNGQMVQMMELMTDDIFAGPSQIGNVNIKNLTEMNFIPDNTFINATWTGLYLLIGQANLVIKNVSSNITGYESIIAQAKFLRALGYFNLVRFYGGVPLVTEPIETYNEALTKGKQRSSVEDIYEQIITDLNEAIFDLPATRSGIDFGKATSGAAKALLAKVYLTMAGHPLMDHTKYALAASLAKDVMDSRIYSLDPNYLDIFSNAYNNEMIFQVLFDASLGRLSGTSFIGIWTLPSGIKNLGNGYDGRSMLRPSPDLYFSFDESKDLRFKTGFFTEITNPANVTAKFGPHIYKYIEPDIMAQGLTLESGGRSYPVLRFADILLIYAEAANEANGGPTVDAYEAIDSVRKRAALAPLSNGLTQDAFRDSVYAERRRELFCEGHRWFDLTRTGRLIDAVNISKTNYPGRLDLYFSNDKNPAFIYVKTPLIRDTILPIPQSQIDVMGGELEQNDAWK